METMWDYRSRQGAGEGPTWVWLRGLEFGIGTEGRQWERGGGFGIPETVLCLQIRLAPADGSLGAWLSPPRVFLWPHWSWGPRSLREEGGGRLPASAPSQLDLSLGLWKADRAMRVWAA